MNENSSNSMDSEDSFTQLCDPCSEVVAGSVTSTPKSTVTNDFNVEEFKNELIKEINVLKEKVGQLEDKNNYLENEIKNNEKKSNGIISNLNIKIDELENKLKHLNEGKRVFFENVENKWKFIHTDFPCCKNKCVNTENPNGLCIKGNGYIQIKSDTNIEYIKSTNEKGQNSEALIRAENSFDKPNKDYFVLFQKYLNYTIYSLFYYEVKFQFEEDVLIEIGLQNKDFYIALETKKNSITFNDHVIDYYSSIKIAPLIFNNNDVIGCGLVYPPPLNILNKLPYVFFTHNGTQVGKAILLKENVEYLKPEIYFDSCSVEANFGNDLNTKPFIYNISNHYPVEEFYRNDEFKKIELN